MAALTGADPVTGLPPTQWSRLRACWDVGDFSGVLRIAAVYGDLGDARDAVLAAWDAVQNGLRYRQSGQDPDALIRAGLAALAHRFQL